MFIYKDTSFWKTNANDSLSFVQIHPILTPNLHPNPNPNPKPYRHFQAAVRRVALSLMFTLLRCMFSRECWCLKHVLTLRIKFWLKNDTATKHAIHENYILSKFHGRNFLLPSHSLSPLTLILTKWHVEPSLNAPNMLLKFTREHRSLSISIVFANDCGFRDTTGIFIHLMATFPLNQISPCL